MSKALRQPPSCLQIDSFSNISGYPNLDFCVTFDNILGPVGAFLTSGAHFCVTLVNWLRFNRFPRTHLPRVGDHVGIKMFKSVKNIKKKYPERSLEKVC